MNKLPKQKRDQLLVVILGTVLIISALYMLLISSQKKSLERLKKATSERQEKLTKATQVLNQSTTLEKEFQTNAETLGRLEETMSSSGDPFAWMVETMARFRTAHQLNIINISRESQVAVGILPKFPYRAVLFQLKGTAHFHDLGKFMAEFENTFPFARIQNIDLTPLVPLSAEDFEKLNFTFEVVTLVKPNTT
jgi:Tfp pilus assembly protein PilO